MTAWNIARKLRLIDSDGVSPFAFIIILVAVCVIGTALMGMAIHHDRVACEAKGGHLEQVGSHTTVISTGKSTYVAVMADYACLEAKRA